MVDPMERGMMENTVYLLPGRGNRLQDLGETIASLGFDVWGREIFPPFSTLNFAGQIQIIQNDLRSWFWHEGAKLVGHSYGGYLLLQALADLEAFPGHILLISPVLGAARGKLYLSRPPRADKLLKLAEEHQFPVPQGLEIHTGEADDGCDPDLARRIGAFIPCAQVHVVPHTGHALTIDYLNKVIHRFLVKSDGNPAGGRWRDARERSARGDFSQSVLAGSKTGGRDERLYDWLRRSGKGGFPVPAEGQRGAHCR